MHQQSKSATDCTELIRTSTAYESQSYITFQFNLSACKPNQNLPIKEKMPSKPGALELLTFGLEKRKMMLKCI